MRMLYMGTVAALSLATCLFVSQASSNVSAADFWRLKERENQALAQMDAEFARYHQSVTQFVFDAPTLIEQNFNVDARTRANALRLFAQKHPDRLGEMQQIAVDVTATTPSEAKRILLIEYYTEGGVFRDDSVAMARSITDAYQAVENILAAMTTQKTCESKWTYLTYEGKYKDFGNMFTHDDRVTYGDVGSSSALRARAKVNAAVPASVAANSLMSITYIPALSLIVERAKKMPAPSSPPIALSGSQLHEEPSRTSWRFVKGNLSALAVPTPMYRVSRESQVAGSRIQKKLYAGDLKKSAFLDMAYLLHRSEQMGDAAESHRVDLMNAFKHIHQRNLDICLYENKVLS